MMRNVRVQIGSSTEYVESKAPLMADGKWHEVHMITYARLDPDGVLYWGVEGQPNICWIVDGEA